MILVTGATGFLGHHLIPQLRQAGYAVRALVRPTSEVGFLLEHGVELAYAEDISDYEAVLAACQGCTAIIHAAGLFRFWGDLPMFWKTNVDGTAAMLEAAVNSGIQRIVHVSTIAVVGHIPPGTLLDENVACQPQDNYQRTKYEGERMAIAFHRELQAPVVIVRPGAFYGPWGRYAFNRLFFEEPLRGWRIKVDGGRHVIFPVYAADVARGIILALEHGRPGQIYNISGHSLTHNEANKMVSDLAGISRWRMNIPRWAVLALAHAWTFLSQFTGREPFYPINLRLYVFQDWNVSIAKAQRELGFEPTPFPEGAQATLAWYKAQKILGRW